MVRSFYSHARTNFVGYLALFVALGGTAWALDANSVGSRQIKNRSVKRVDVAGGVFGSAPATATFSSHDPADFYLPGSGGATQVIMTGDHTNGDTGGGLIHLSAPGVVMATASLAIRDNSTTPEYAQCQFGIAPNGSPNPVPFGQLTVDSIEVYSTAQQGMAAGVRKPAGDYYVNVGCGATDADAVQFLRGDLVVWALPQR